MARCPLEHSGKIGDGFNANDAAGGSDLAAERVGVVADVGADIDGGGSPFDQPGKEVYFALAVGEECFAGAHKANVGWDHFTDNVLGARFRIGCGTY